MKRVTRVRQLIDENFNGRQADFAKAIKKAPTQVSHWLTGERNIGDGVASQIEAAFDLPRGCRRKRLLQQRACRNCAHD